MALTKVTYSMIDGSPVNVRDYGAVGDGVTNDTAAFVAAIASGQPIFLPEGEYLITSTLTVDNKSLIISGDNNTAKIIYNQATGSVFSFVNSSSDKRHYIDSIGIYLTNANYSGSAIYHEGFRNDTGDVQNNFKDIFVVNNCDIEGVFIQGELNNSKAIHCNVESEAPPNFRYLFNCPFTNNTIKNMGNAFYYETPGQYGFINHTEIRNNYIMYTPRVLYCNGGVGGLNSEIGGTLFCENMIQVDPDRIAVSGDLNGLTYASCVFLINTAATEFKENNWIDIPSIPGGSFWVAGVDHIVPLAVTGGNNNITDDQQYVSYQFVLLDGNADNSTIARTDAPTIYTPQSSGGPLDFRDLSVEPRYVAKSGSQHLMSLLVENRFQYFTALPQYAQNYPVIWTGKIDVLTGTGSSAIAGMQLDLRTGTTTASQASSFIANEQWTAGVAISGTKQIALSCYLYSVLPTGTNAVLFIGSTVSNNKRVALYLDNTSFYAQLADGSTTFISTAIAARTGNDAIVITYDGNFAYYTINGVFCGKFNTNTPPAPFPAPLASSANLGGFVSNNATTSDAILKIRYAQIVSMQR